MTLLEALYQLLEDGDNILNDEKFSIIRNCINVLSNQNMGKSTYISSDFDGLHFLRISVSETIKGVSDFDLVKWEYPNLLKMIKEDLELNIIKLPLEHNPFSNFKTAYYALRSQKDICSILSAKISQQNILNQVVNQKRYNLDLQFKENMLMLENKLILRKVSFAYAAYCTKTPVLQYLKSFKAQRTFLQTHKKDGKDPDLHNFNTALMQEIIKEGIASLQQEQSFFSDLLDKATSLIENSIDCRRETAATLYSNIDKEQRKCLVNSLPHLQAFLTETKNSATLIESLTTGTAMVIKLSDFNKNIGSLCKNVWRQVVIQYKETVRSEKKLQEQLQLTSSAEIDKTQKYQDLLNESKETADYLFGVNVGQKCYEKIYEMEKARRDCKYWRNRIKAIEKTVQDELHGEFSAQIEETAMELKNCETQFSDYREILMAQLKSEISANNEDFSKKPKTERDPSKETAAELYDQYAKLQEKLHKLKLSYSMRLASFKNEFETKTALMRKQLTASESLQEELTEAEAREKILKEELSNTQKNILACDRALKQLEVSLKEKDEALLRFQQTKVSILCNNNVLEFQRAKA